MKTISLISMLIIASAQQVDNDQNGEVEQRKDFWYCAVNESRRQEINEECLMPKLLSHWCISFIKSISNMLIETETPVGCIPFTNTNSLVQSDLTCIVNFIERDRAANPTLEKTVSRSTVCEFLDLLGFQYCSTLRACPNAKTVLQAIFVLTHLKLQEKLADPDENLMLVGILCPQGLSNIATHPGIFEVQFDEQRNELILGFCRRNGFRFQRLDV